MTMAFDLKAVRLKELNLSGSRPPLGRQKLKPMEELTQDQLKEVLDYNLSTGVFTWKKPSSRAPVKVGDIAGCVRRNYVVIRIGYNGYEAHRLAWLYVYGRWPNEIDHIDRDGTNNRLSNLVEADRSIQVFNSYRSSPSGHRGVYWDKAKSKWRANITWQDNRLYLGRFDNFEEAVAARQAAEIKLLGCLTEELKDPANRRPKFVRRA